MFTPRVVPALVFAAMLLPLSLAAAPQIFKCTLNGAVSYQRDPCPTGEERPSPTAQQLNAERQRKLRQAASSPAPGTTQAPQLVADAAPPAPSGKNPPRSTASPTAQPAVSFKCDGRKYCSQMTSCAEAKYFLAHCAGVAMDGDHNGLPCERQWCNK